MLIRMARSLVMTRLLFPEVYGLMTLVWAALTGLQMFADTGIGTTIVRDARGDDPAFLNTAFTTNVLRGIGLGLPYLYMGLYPPRFTRAGVTWIFEGWQYWICQPRQSHRLF